MNELNNTIINNLRNESLKIYKELSNTEDIVKKAKLIENLALLSNIEIAINKGKACRNGRNISVKVELSDKSVCFLEYCQISKIFTLSICL